MSEFDKVEAKNAKQAEKAKQSKEKEEQRRYEREDEVLARIKGGKEQVSKFLKAVRVFTLA